MKKVILLVFWAVCTIVAATYQVEGQVKPAGIGTQSSAEVTKHLVKFSHWWKYHSQNIDLSGDFIPIDEQGRRVSLDAFFKKLLSGKYVVSRTGNNNRGTAIENYNLVVIPSAGDKGISPAIRSVAGIEYNNYKKIGTRMATFNLTDLNGKIYSNGNTIGKILVLKTWFIGCVQCVQEMPELNELVDKYQKRKDVVFLSLATDPRKKLIKFLQKRSFNYPVVPDQEAFITETLKLNVYPTHIVVNKKGEIIGCVNNVKSLKRILSEASSDVSSSRRAN